MNDTTTRLNKFISDSGFCSRREADRLIEQGRVVINGKIAVIGTQVSTGDNVSVDGEHIGSSLNKQRLYIAFNKPTGITCTTDLNDKDNIIDFIGHPERIFHIGRLDKQSEGLIFLTNDGDIVNKILRAGNNHEKEYIVNVDRAITPEFAYNMGHGVRILGTKTQPCKFIKESNTRFRIILTQGMNRQIRRMCEALDYKVLGLRRVRIMNITLKGLATGQWRYFTDNEIEALNAMISNSVGTSEASALLPPKKPKSNFQSRSSSHSRVSSKQKAHVKRASRGK